MKTPDTSKKTTSSSAETTYSEVRILRTEPPAELPGAQQAAEPNERSKVTWQTVALLVLSALLAAAVIALCVTLNKNIQTAEHLRKLQYDHDAMKKNLSETRCEPTPCSTVQPTCPTPPEVKINQPCQKCEGGWEQDGGQCYFFSISRSSWEDSRNECKRRGGDLVKIDSREEQSFLKNRLQKMDNRDKFWIGLTDSAVEGEWLWVDGSQLSKSLSFWFWQEPDNWRLENPDGEDCARMGEGWWWDKSCKAPQKSICEKQEEMGRTAVTCV
ncbi:CD209 antigen-like protein E [Seriola lalandi dorsalis]|uniref:CD209 antigen-like protein E n=1 Tax=Seriola lalandi dorsalis TaxID=1841481 RepID=UPI000C6F61BA|nr:CD209 antigen-like protein E [Seriola lalandi dorsalis]